MEFKDAGSNRTEVGITHERLLTRRAWAATRRAGPSCLHFWIALSLNSSDAKEERCSREHLLVQESAVLEP